MALITDLYSIFQQNEFDKAIAMVSNWDFSLTKQKLQEPSYAGWTEERVERAEQNYKRYLAVTKALNGYQLVPNSDVDRFWHEHILDTRRYAQDCTELFGGFLHHYPYFGMRGEADNQSWLSTSRQSTDIWEYLFREPLYENSVALAQKCPQKCPGGIEDSIEKPLYENSVALAQKCPQKCPGGIEDSIEKPLYENSVALAQKCPQKCPGGIEDSIEKPLYENSVALAQKCPQKCPGGIEDSIDRNYPYLSLAASQ